MEEMESDRSFFGTLFKLALFIGIVMVIAKAIAAKKQEYYGISESEARYKVESKLSPRVGDDRAAEIADQVVAKLKQAGVVTADGAAGDMSARAEDAANEMVDAAEKVADDASDSVEEAVEELTGD